MRLQKGQDVKGIKRKMKAYMHMKETEEDMSDEKTSLSALGGSERML